MKQSHALKVEEVKGGKQATCDCGWVSPVRENLAGMMCPHDPEFVPEPLEEESAE